MMRKFGSWEIVRETLAAGREALCAGSPACCQSLWAAAQKREGSLSGPNTVPLVGNKGTPSGMTSFSVLPDLSQRSRMLTFCLPLLQSSATVLPLHTHGHILASTFQNEVIGHPKSRPCITQLVLGTSTPAGLGRLNSCLTFSKVGPTRQERVKTHSHLNSELWLCRF